MNATGLGRPANWVTSVSNDAMERFDATALALQIARGARHPSEVAEAAIARAEAVNPRLNAIAAVDYERARTRARAPQAGPFSGVPTFIKDTDEVEGWPRTMGSRAVADTPQRRSSACVAQFETLGFNFLGTSNMPEFGFTATTESERFGPARNPWNPEHSTGGSSGGAAALVAANVVPVAHANDGGGSIRIPAACCGLVGLKPTQGRVPTVRIPSFLPMNIVHQGLLSRTVRDTARFYQAIEASVRHPRLPRIGDVTGPSRERLSMAVFVDDVHGARCDEQCATAAWRAAEICEALGHRVRRIRNPFPADFMQHFMLVWAMGPFLLWHFGRRVLSPDFDRSALEGWTKHLQRDFRERMLGVWSTRRYLSRFHAEYDQLFEAYDVLISPTIGTPPPKIGHLGPAVDGPTHLDRLRRFVPFTAFHNVAGAPAISLPLALSAEGLPIGVQFAAARGHDRRLLEIAFELEAAAPWPHLDALPHGAQNNNISPST